MNYLIDNQLPIGLVRHLQAHGLQASHIADCGLERATDWEIWDYTAANACVIVSKDEDFFYLSGADPNGPPFVWVRLQAARVRLCLSRSHRHAQRLGISINQSQA
jgi:predicted nuclease of predicted toxin-antitoxin system